ncbi:DUF1217 domain-containing protein [Roseobacteraceae bacterium S113]
MTFTPIVIGTGLAGYAYLRDTQTAQRETLTNTAQNRREAEQFREAMGSIQTSEDLLDDRLLLRVALGAFGLDEDINNRAFLQQVLDSDLDDPTSLANRLSDKRYFGLAQAFGFNTAAGPQVPGTQEASELAQRLEGVNSAQDLLADTELLVATLRSFDLPAQDADNLYFLENVLTSDPDDPTSFANTLSDTRYGDLARDLDFVARAQTGSLVGLANAAAAADPPIQTADDLLANRDVLDRALDLYGLGSTIAPDTFLLDVLNSDLEDPSSFANTQSDDLWTSFASTFGFGERLARPGSFRAENTRFDGMVEAWAGAPESFEESSEVLRDTSLSLSAVQFFDLKLGDTGFDRIRLVLDSDRDSATSLANVLSDDRYRLLADSIEIAPPSTEWSPPKAWQMQLWRAILSGNSRYALAK